MSALLPTCISFPYNLKTQRKQMADYKRNELYPSFPDYDGKTGGGTTARATYYAEITINFTKNGQPLTGVTYNGVYTSYYSNGQSTTNTISRITTSGSTAGFTLYSFTKSKQGIFTINAREKGSSIDTTYNFTFYFSDKAGIDNIKTGYVFEAAIMKGNVILPSIYKPFYFNAALKIDSANSQMTFSCAIANPIGYRLNNDKYVIGTPVLSIDNEKYYFYNEGAIGSITTGLSCYTTEQEDKYFYITAQSSLTNFYEVRFVYTFENMPFDRTLPHIFSFSATEGAPMDYAGELEIETIEEELNGVKFYDKVAVTGGTYYYALGNKNSNIRNFFLNETSKNNIEYALNNIYAGNYSYDPIQWKSIHTYVEDSNKAKHNLYNREVKAETYSAVTDTAETRTVMERHDHFDITDKNRHYYLGVIDKYTMLNGDTINTKDSEYGIETTEDALGAYTQVPRHTSVLSIIDYLNIG